MQETSVPTSSDSPDRPADLTQLDFQPADQNQPGVMVADYQNGEQKFRVVARCGADLLEHDKSHDDNLYLHFLKELAVSFHLERIDREAVLEGKPESQDQPKEEDLEDAVQFKEPAVMLELMLIDPQNYGDFNAISYALRLTEIPINKPLDAGKSISYSPACGVYAKIQSMTASSFRADLYLNDIRKASVPVYPNSYGSITWTPVPKHYDAYRIRVLGKCYVTGHWDI